MMNRQALADLWWEVMLRPAEDFFADRPDRMTSDPWNHGRTASLGYVGRHYEPGGDVLVGNFPGGGGSRSLERPHPEDERLYGGFKALAAADGQAERLEAFEAMSATWITVQRQHRLYQNLIAPALTAINRQDHEVAFVNTFPFRCHENRPPTKRMRRAAWQLALADQFRLLAPGRIITLGVAAADSLREVYRGPAEVIVLPRRIGDTSIAPEAERRLADLKNRAEAARPEVRPCQDTRQKVRESAGADSDAAEPVGGWRADASNMNFKAYEGLLRDLGFAPPERGRMLRHCELRSTVYINRKRDDLVYFTIYASSREKFAHDYWVGLTPQQKKDDKPHLETVAPRTGVERLALESLLQRQ